MTDQTALTRRDDMIRVKPTFADLVLDAAGTGASLDEIAAYLDTDVRWLRKHYGRRIVQAWAARTIKLRRAQTLHAVHSRGRSVDRLVGKDASPT